jgi:hypothetical protein
MSIDSIGSAPLGGLYAKNTPYNSTLSGSAAASDAETTGSGGQSAANGLVQALSLALQQSGRDTPPVIAPPSSAGSTAEAANNPPPPTPPISELTDQSGDNPVHAFVYALAQALSADAAPTSVSSNSNTYASASGSYASLENRLQNLMASLDSSTPANTSPSLKQLESAFQNLTVQPSSSSNTTAAANGSSLEQFLQTLTQNLATNDQTSGQPLSHTGTLLGTTA